MDDTKQLEYELDRLSRGEPGALHAVIELAYSGLIRQARAVLGGAASIDRAASLVNTWLVVILDQPKLGEFEGVGQFFAFTSKGLRHKLVDRIRRSRTVGRGGKETILRLEGQDVPTDLRTVDYLDLHDALEELKALNERLWLVTENKCFARMTNAEIARGLDLSEKVIEKDWTFAKAWLAQRLGGGDDTRTVRAGA